MQGVRFQFFFHICSGVGLGRNFVFCKCGVSFSEVTSDGIQKPIPLLHLSFLAALQHPGREEGPLPWPLGRQTSLAKSPHWELGQGRCFRSRSPGLPYPTGLHLQCIFLTVQAPSSNGCFAGALPLAAEDLILAALISRRFDISGSFPPPPDQTQLCVVSAVSTRTSTDEDVSLTEAQEPCREPREGKFAQNEGWGGMVASSHPTYSWESRSPGAGHPT